MQNHTQINPSPSLSRTRPQFTAAAAAARPRRSPLRSVDLLLSPARLSPTPKRQQRAACGTADGRAAGRRRTAYCQAERGREGGERAASERRGGKWAARFRGGGRTHATARSWRVEIAAYLDLILSDDQPKTASSSPRTNSPPPLATILSSGEKFVLLPLPSNRSSSSTSRSASSAQGFGSNLVTLPLLRASGCHQGMLPLPSPSLLLSSLPPHACAMFLLFFILSVASSTSRIHPC